MRQFFESQLAQAGSWGPAALYGAYGPIIIGWSFFPLAPTDLICYVCGVLRVRFWKFLLGVTLGEGAISAIYIYGGDQILWWLGLKN